MGRFAALRSIIKLRAAKRPSVLLYNGGPLYGPFPIFGKHPVFGEFTLSNKVLDSFIPKAGPRHSIFSRNILKETIHYFPYTIIFISQTKILRKNIELLGAALDRKCRLFIDYFSRF